MTKMRTKRHLVSLPSALVIDGRIDELTRP